MTKKPKVVFAPTDVPLTESLDCTLRNRIMVTEETCGAQQHTAGLFYVRQGTKGHPSKHEGQEEIYYIFAGRGVIMIDDEPHKMEAGDVVFIPGSSTHYIINEGNETIGLFWTIAKKWSGLMDIQREVGDWREVEAGSDWSPFP